MISCSVGIMFFSFIVFGTAQKWMGPGIWQVMKVMECKYEYPYKISVSTKKINRTHYAIDCSLDIPDAIDDTVGVRIEVCKHVDGGCKPYRVVMFTSLEDASYRWAKNNTEDIMEQAGVDPPQFPVKAGRYELNNYIFNYDELPKSGSYGNFDAKIFFTKNKKDVACLNVLYQFKKAEEK